MEYQITDYMLQNENGWVALDRDTHDVYDRDLDLKKLSERIDAAGLKPEVTYTKNHFRFVPYRTDKKYLDSHRQFLKENRSARELRVFNAKIKKGAPKLGFDLDVWPITPRRKASIWLKKKERQLKDLLGL